MRPIVSLIAVIFLFCAIEARAASDKDELIRIESYLNTITTLEADFKVRFPNSATIVPGKAYLSRPGKMRLDYEDPMPILVIADGSFLIHYDKKLKQASWVGLSEAPSVELMVRSKIMLDDKDIKILKVTRTTDTVSVELQLPDAPQEMKSLTLVFNHTPLYLTQWIEKYEDGDEILVTFSGLKINTPLSPELFVFNDPRFSDSLHRGRGRGR